MKSNEILRDGSVNFLTGSGLEALLTGRFDHHRLARGTAGDLGSAAATVIFIPIILTTLAKRGPAAAAVVYFGVSKGGAETGTAIYDVLYFGTVAARDAVVEALTHSNEVPHGLVSRQYLYAEDGTSKEYVTHRTAGRLQVFVTKRDIFGRVVGEPYSFVPEQRGQEVSHNLVTTDRYAQHIQAFAPRRVALMGRDGRWYAVDLNDRRFFSVDPEAGRTLEPVSFESPEAWAEVFGPGPAGKDLTGLVSQDDTVAPSTIGRLLEAERPKRADERERRRLERATKTLERELRGWTFHWQGETYVELSRSGKTFLGVAFVYDPKTGRFRPIRRDGAAVQPGADKRSEIRIEPSAPDERSMASEDTATPEVRMSYPDTQMQRLDASSPQFDAQAALLHRLEEMQVARRAEARPPHENHKHLPQGRLLLTSAKRAGEYKGHLRVPVPERRPPPSRRERLDALSAHYGDLMRQSKGTPLEAALQKEFVVAFRAVQLDQDQRDRETAWAHATKADPEIGGRNLAQSLQDARYGLDRFGDPELYDYLDDSGLGNHPEVIRMFKRAGAYARKERPWAPTTVDRPGWQERERPKGLQWLSVLVPTTQSDVP